MSSAEREELDRLLAALALDTTAADLRQEVEFLKAEKEVLRETIVALLDVFDPKPVEGSVTLSSVTAAAARAMLRRGGGQCS